MQAVSGGTKLNFLPKATFEESRELMALTQDLKSLVPRDGRLADLAAPQPDNPLLLGRSMDDRARLAWTFTVQQTCDLLRLCTWRPALSVLQVLQALPSSRAPATCLLLPFPTQLGGTCYTAPPVVTRSVRSGAEVFPLPSTCMCSTVLPCLHALS
jgi:hypothetical protein